MKRNLVNSIFVIITLLALAFSTTGVTPVSAAAIDLSNNLGNSADGAAFITPTQSSAQAFSTDATHVQITSVVLPICRYDLITGNFAIEIWDTSGVDGTPGAKVADVAANQDVAGLPDSDVSAKCTSNVTYSSLSISLSPSTTYYMVIRSVSLSGAALSWNASLDTAGTGFPSNRSTYDGSSWSTPTTVVPQIMQVAADVTPSTAIDLSNNLGNSVDGAAFITPTQSSAQAFSTDATHVQITSVVLPICRYDLITGNFAIEIWDTSGVDGTPGAKVADVAANQDVAGLPDSDVSAKCTSNVTYSSLSISLSPSTTYYMVIRSVSLSGAALSWNASLDTAGTGFPSNRSTYDGSSWSTPTTVVPQIMQVAADVAPSTAIDLSNNLGNSADGAAFITPTQSSAQAFSTDATHVQITSVVLPICRYDLITGNFAIEIWDTSGVDGTPGAKVADVAANQDVAGLPDSDVSAKCTSNVTYSSLSISLSPSTTYYMVIRSVSLSGAALSWNASLDTAGTGFPSNRSTYDGSSWSTPTTVVPQIMQVAADAPACPSTITVTNNNDSGTGSLRQAIADVCAGGTIDFDNSYAITLTTGDLTITKNLTIDGTAPSSRVSVSGNDASRAFHVSGSTVTLKNLTITNGTAGAGIGGGIYNAGTLTVANSTFFDNVAEYGGGIFNSGTLTVVNSTFSGNSAGTAGGGIRNDSTTTVINSTFSANSASDNGGGISNTGTLNYTNTIIANSTTGGDCSNSGTIGTNTNNLVENGGCSAALSGDPLLSALGNHGGGNQTFALQTGSPAINAGDDTICAAAPVSGKDQRDIVRPQGTHCDIGAFEVATYTVTFDSAGGSAVSSQTVVEGSKVTEPDAPTKAGYTFNGWNNGVTAWDFSTGTVSSNLTLTAQWVTVVTFNTNGGSGSMSNQVNNVTTALTTNSFTRTGYTFAGWNTADNGSGTSYADGASYDFTANVTLYAQWTINQYTITFDSNGGSSVTAITQDYNTSVSAPTAPTKIGYTFAGWYSDAGLTSAYTFSTMPASDITLYAKWTDINPTVASIVRTDVNPTSAASVNFTATFSEPVTGVDVSDFKLTNKLLLGASITGVTPVSSTVYTITVNTGSRNGSIRLDVRGTADIEDLNANNFVGPYIGGQTYTVNKGAAPSVPALVSPANNFLSKDYTPLLDWADSTISGGSILAGYELQISSPFTSFTSLNLTLGTTSSYTPASDLPANATYYWRVRAFNTTGQYGGWSAFRTFRTAFTPTTLVSPANGSALDNKRPTLEWDAVEDTTSYTVQLSLVSNFATIAGTYTTDTYELVLAKDLLGSKQYYWRVISNGDNGPSDPSAAFSFTTANPPSTPNLSAPAANASVEAAAQLFDWSNSTLLAGVTFDHYEIEIAHDAEFTDIFQSASTTVGVTNSQLTSNPLVTGTTYYWHVRSVSSAPTTAYSAWSAYRVVKAKFVVPTLLTPANVLTPVLGDTTPEFTWTAVNGATNYTIDIATNSKFTTGLKTATVAGTTYTPVTGLIPGQTYFWRVRVNGIYTPVYSAVWSFKP